jgi:hypothetical protein
MDNFPLLQKIPPEMPPEMPQEMPDKEPFVPHTPVLPPGPLLINNDIEEKYDIKPFKSAPKKNRVRKVSRSTRIRKSIVREENKINRSKKRIDSLNKKLSQQLKKDKKKKPKSKPKMSKKQRKAIQKQIKSLKKKLSLKGGTTCGIEVNRRN